MPNSSTFLSDDDGQPYQFMVYLPFGETMAEQTVTGWATPYMFNGKELDDNTGLYYYGARFYDPRISIWHGVDPLADIYPSMSPYNYVGNNPINYIDPDGRYILPAHLAKKYSKLANYLQNGIGNLLNQKDIRSGLKIIGNFNDDQINELSRYGEGIPIDIKQLDNDMLHSSEGEINGYTPGDGSIQIDATLAQQLQDANTPEAEAVALLGLVSTIVHKSTHVGFNTNSVPYNRASREMSDGNFSRTYNPKSDIYTYYYQAI